jgi:hydrogenase expression/formation protein HypC
MCLGVPGKVLSVDENDLGVTMGTVSFAGVRKQVCLAYVPEVEVDDYVLVHVGFAISKVDERHAADVLRALKELGELHELDTPPP